MTTLQHRAALITLLLSTFALPFVISGCDDDDEEEIVNESGGDLAAGQEADLDLISHVHLADVFRDGLFIDFGTPAQDKYTVGDWRSGWGAQGEEDGVTFAYAGRRGRVYFHMDEAQAIKLRVRLRPHGTGAMSPYLNGSQVQSVRFENAGGFRDVDVDIPADKVRAGENSLQLVFGGVTTVGGNDVSVAVDSIRIAPASAGDSYEAPTYASMTGNVTLGDVERPAVSVTGSTRVSWYAQIPDAGNLVVGVGARGAGASTARIFVTPQGGDKTKVFEQAVTTAWTDQLVSLASYAGKVARIDVVTQGEAPVAWSRLALTHPAPPELNLTRAKNVVVVLVDTLRASKLKVWNPRSRVRTPVLDALAEDSVVYERGQSTENWTKPAVGAILTSLHPMTHGARTQEAVLSDRALMISEHFKAHGFATGGFIANGYISDRFGFDQGWDRYRNFIREEGSSEAENVFGEAGQWAEEHKDERFFLYVHTIDPHVPYDPEQEFVSMYDSRGGYEGQVRPRMTGELLANAKKNPPTVVFNASDVRRLSALHDGEITQHDQHMGAFIERLKRLGIWDETVFVFVSDHGEEFNEHGSWGHGHSIYQELLHVPFLIHAPGVQGRRVSTTVSTMDIGPTVLELAGVPALPRSEGRSIVRTLYGQPLVGPAVAMSEFLDERRVVTAGRWKFFVRGNLTASMFDLQEDPGEENQLSTTDRPIAERYLRILSGQYLGATDRGNWLDAEQQDFRALTAGEVEMDDQLQQQLRELGYL